jgi:hypothetical protein
MPERPLMMPPVGKSGPVMGHQLVDGEVAVFDQRQATVDDFSVRLCGGMLVAMPTAIPLAVDQQVGTGSA